MLWVSEGFIIQRLQLRQKGKLYIKDVILVTYKVVRNGSNN